MAAAPFHSFWGVPELRLFYSLLAFWSAFVGNGSAVTVTQEPTFAKGLPGTGVSFRCSVNEADYHFYWYRQVPGKTELEFLGYFNTYSSSFEDSPQKWKNRLKAKWENQAEKKMSLDLTGLQPGDTGFYLCAAVNTVNEGGTGTGTKLEYQEQICPLLFSIDIHLLPDIIPIDG